MVKIVIPMEPPSANHYMKTIPVAVKAEDVPAPKAVPEPPKKPQTAKEKASAMA